MVVIALVLGPIMYALPSPKDKRLSSLRLAARQAGLEVKLTQIPKLDPEAHERVSSGGIAKEAKLACTAYRLAHDTERLADCSGRQLLRIPQAPTITFTEVFPGWAIQDPEGLDWWRSNRQFWIESLANLPREILAIEVDGRFLACYWRESGDLESGMIERISDALKSIRIHFSS